jgi:hypothetical protein
MLAVSVSIALALLVGCDAKWLGIQGSGITKTESRDVSDFTKLSIEGHGIINVEFGDEPSLRLTCDDNLLEFVETEVDGDELRISHTETIDPSDALRIDIVVKTLSEIDLSGAAKLNIQSAKLDDLRLSISGSANIQADGTAENVVIRVSGAANISAGELRAKSVDISISGTGNAEVYASEWLEASVSGAGKINCLGSPQIRKQEVSGVGRIQVEKDNGTQAEAE